MGIIVAAIVIAAVLAGVAAYQLYKSKKAVTAGNVVTELKADASTVKSDVTKS